MTSRPPPDVEYATRRAGPVAWLILLVSATALGRNEAAAQELTPSQAIAALQAKCTEAVERSQRSVVAIARVSRDANDAGFQVPNLGRFGSGRLDELFPTDADYVPTEFGAGVVIDPAGLIVTTYHVLGDVANSEYYVWSQHVPYKAQVVAADGWSDLAVLKVDAKDLVPIPWGDGAAVRKGDFVLALGNPQAIARDGEVSATWGMIANLKRRAPPVAERAAPGAGRESLHHYGTLLHLDRPLHLGYSGGALLNLRGEMIGLITAYAGIAAEAKSATFAIPVDEPFRQVINRLKVGKSPEFGFLGIGLQPLDARLRRQGQHGTVVESVTPGTAAARADIQPGDIITHCDGVPVYDDDELIREVSSRPPGQSVKLRLLRAGDQPSKTEALEKTAVLTKRAAETLRPSIATVAPPDWRGMRVEDATAAPRPALIAVQLPPTGGLYISHVAPDSAAWKAGLRSGLFVTTAAGRPLTTSQEFFDLVQPETGDIPLQILSTSGETSVHTVSP